MPTSTHTVVPVTDAKPMHRQGGEFRFAITPLTTATTGGLMGQLTLEVDEHLIEHYHPFTDEYLFVVTGQLIATVEGDRVAVPPGCCLFIQRGAHHQFENGATEQTRVVVALSPLAPRPELGHVDCAEPVVAGELPEPVGGHR